MSHGRTGDGVEVTGLFNARAHFERSLHQGSGEERTGRPDRKANAVSLLTRAMVATALLGDLIPCACVATALSSTSSAALRATVAIAPIAVRADIDQLAAAVAAEPAS